MLPFILYCRQRNVLLARTSREEHQFPIEEGASKVFRVLPQTSGQYNFIDRFATSRNPDYNFLGAFYSSINYFRYHLPHNWMSSRTAMCVVTACQEVRTVPSDREMQNCEPEHLRQFSRICFSLYSA